MSAGGARSDYRVVVVDDHASFAESLELVLGMQGFDVRRSGPEDLGLSDAQLLSRLEAMRPDVILLDLDLGSFGDATRLIHPLAASGHDVVVITAYAEPARWGECLRLGARRAISKSGPLAEIGATIRRLHQGQPVMEAAEREDLLARWREERAVHQDALRRLDTLSRREQQVLGHLMAGRLVSEIAREAVVSEATVRTQVKAILAKLGVSSQLSAVGLAHRVHWRPPSVPAPRVAADARSSVFRDTAARS